MVELFLQTDNKKQYQINDLQSINPTWLTLGKIDLPDKKELTDDTEIKLRNPYVSPLNIMNYIDIDMLFSGEKITLGEFKKRWTS